MAIISVDVPDKIAIKYSSYKVVSWNELSKEENLLDIDWDNWESIVDFWKWVKSWEILDYMNNLK